MTDAKDRVHQISTFCMNGAQLYPNGIFQPLESCTVGSPHMETSDNSSLQQVGEKTGSSPPSSERELREEDCYDKLGYCWPV